MFYMHASEYLLYMASRIYGHSPNPRPKENENVEKTVKIMRFVVVDGFRVPDCSASGRHDARRAAAEPAAKPAASPGAAALEKAAKDNKYLFIFFWREDTQHSRVMRGVFQAAMAKMADKAADRGDSSRRRRRKRQIVARYDVSRSPMPLVLAIAPNGAVTKGLADAVRRRAASASVRQPVHGRVHEGPPGAQARAPVRPEAAAAGPDGGAAQERAGLHRRCGICEDHQGRRSEPRRCGRGGSSSRDIQVDPQTVTPVTVLMAPPAAVIGSYADEVTKERLGGQAEGGAIGCCGPGCSCHH